MIALSHLCLLVSGLLTELKLTLFLQVKPGETTDLTSEYDPNIVIFMMDIRFYPKDINKDITFKTAPVMKVCPTAGQYFSLVRYQSSDLCRCLSGTCASDWKSPDQLISHNFPKGTQKCLPHWDATIMVYFCREPSALWRMITQTVFKHLTFTWFSMFRELSFFTRRGAHLSVIAGRQFFLLHAAKMLPTLLTYVKKTGPLWVPKKCLPPPRRKKPSYE